MFDTEIMSVADFLSFPDYPRQSRTKRHAKPLLASMTTGPITDQVEIVALVEIGDKGAIYKIDGHTRAELWRSKLLPPPAALTVHVFYTETTEEANALFEQFNSARNLRTTTDLIAGVFSEAKINLTSSRLSSGKLSMVCTVLGVAEGLTQTPKSLSAAIQQALIGRWMPEFTAIDPYFGINHRALHSGIVAAALLSVRKHGPKAKAFWEMYRDNPGDIAQSHPVARLRREMKDGGNARRMRNGAGVGVEVCARALSCVERFRLGQKSGVSRLVAVDIATYLGVPPPKVARVGTYKKIKTDDDMVSADEEKAILDVLHRA